MSQVVFLPWLGVVALEATRSGPQRALLFALKHAFQWEGRQRLHDVLLGARLALHAFKLLTLTFAA